MKVKSVLIAAFTLFLAGCGSDEKKVDVVKPASSASTGAVAYVDMDSLQAHYQFYLDGKASLEQKVNAYQTSVQQKEKALQEMQESIQRKMQQGQITTEAQYKAEVDKFNRQQNAYAQYRSTTEQELAEEQDNFARALQDSLDSFLKDFNRSKKYTMIFNKAVMLYGDAGMDITDEVVAGLNKRYQKK